MSITGEVVRNYKRDVSQLYASPQITAVLQNAKIEQFQFESGYLKTYNACSTSPLRSKADVVANSSGISRNRARISQTLKYEFYDSERIKAIECALNTLIYEDRATDDPARLGRLHTWLTKPKVIGTPSVSGIAVRMYIKDLDSSFIVKAPRLDPQSLLHETVVGLELNKLRKKVLNFSYVFGGFNCTPPYVMSQKENAKDVLGWCIRDSANGVRYVVYENVAPAVPLRDFVKTCTFAQWLSAYMQIMYSIRLAYKELDFTHYDLHDENVLVRTLPSVVGLSYDTPSGLRYIATNQLAMMIDYGLSHISLNGRGVGEFGYEKYGVYHDRSEPLHDAFKLLLMSMRSMKNAGNQQCLRGAARLLRYFDTRPVDIVLQDLEANYFSYPTGVGAVFNKEIYKFESRTFEDYLISVNRNVAPTLLQIQKTTLGSIPILSCDTALEKSPNKPAYRYSAKTDIDRVSRVPPTILDQQAGVSQKVPYLPGPVCANNKQAFAELGMLAPPLESQLSSLYDLYRTYMHTPTVNRQALLQKNQPLYSQGALQVASFLERQMADFSIRCSRKTSPIPTLREVDDIVACFSNASDIEVSVDILHFLAGLYRDGRSIDITRRMKQDLERIRNTSLLPSLSSIQDARDATVDPKAKQSYTEALKTLS